MDEPGPNLGMLIIQAYMFMFRFVCIILILASTNNHIIIINPMDCSLNQMLHEILNTINMF